MQFAKIQAIPVHSKATPITNDNICLKYIFQDIKTTCHRSQRGISLQLGWRATKTASKILRVNQTTYTMHTCCIEMSPCCWIPTSLSK